MMAGLAVLAVFKSVAVAQYAAADLYAMPGASYLTPSFGGPISGAFGGQVVAGELLWKTDGSATDLRVPNYFQAHLNGTDGVHQFGDVNHSIPDDNPLARHPVVWTGTAASATFLDETGLLPLSRINGAGGAQFVGTGNTIAGGLAGNHALLWSSLNATVVDLNPTNLTGFFSCGANGTSGSQQVGSGFTFADGGVASHGLLWTGSADSAVDLKPTLLGGFFDSHALATDGQQQVGSGGVQNTSNTHALLWQGTAASAVDLNPSGFAGSVASAVANGKQVGYGYGPNNSPWNALLWTGTANSALNLHQFLSAEFSQSRAYGIDNAGHVFGVAFSSSDERWHAVEWTPLPEPSVVGLFLPLAASALTRRQRRSRRQHARPIRSAFFSVKTRWRPRSG
jgi:hypothetical protein